MSTMTGETRAAAAAANMDPQILAQLLRAARGQRQAPTGDVAMGIRYRTPAAAAQPAPVDRRPLWMTLAPAGVLEEIAETAPRRAKVTKATRPASTRPTSAPTSAPAEAKPAASRKPAPAARVAEAARQRVLGSYDAFACEACGSRYSQPFTDHGCGPLTPVTVTITTKTAGGSA